MILIQELDKQEEGGSVKWQKVKKMLVIKK